MHELPRRSPFIPLFRIATLVALGDLVTKQVALLWIGALEPRAAAAVRFGVVHNDKGAFGLTAGDYTFELSLALTLAAIVLIVPVATIVPCPGMRRGTLAVVPSVPGLVSVIVAPAKSSGDSLFVRAFSTSSS